MRRSSRKTSPSPTWRSTSSARRARCSRAPASSKPSSAARRHDEDQLAFLRDERDFRNCTLVELPRGDFAVTMLRNLRRRDLSRAALAAARGIERRRARGDRRQGRQGSALPPRARRRLGRPPRRRDGGIGGATEGGARPALAVRRRDLRGRRRRRASRRGGPRPALGRPARRLARRLRCRALAAAGLASPRRARVPQHRQDRPPQRAPRLRAGRDAASAALVSGRRVVMIDAAFGTPLSVPPRRAAGSSRSSAPGRCSTTVLDPEVPVVSVVDLGIVRAVSRRRRCAHRRRHADLLGLPGDRGDRAEHRRGARRRRPRPDPDPHAACAGLDERLDQRRKGRPSCAATASHRPGRSTSPRRARFASSPRAIAPLACPRCESKDTERLAAFGATACKALWRCRACGEPFEHFKSI